MRTFFVFALVGASLALSLTGCGRSEPWPPLQLRWPPASDEVRASWRASVARWAVTFRTAEGAVRRVGTGTVPEVIVGPRVPDVRAVRVELWLSDASRPLGATPTFAGEGPWPGAAVPLGLWDSRWLRSQPPTTR